MAALLDLDPGFVEIGEAVGQAEKAGGDGLAASGGAFAGGVVGAERDDLFDVADGKPLRDDPVARRSCASESFSPRRARA